MSNEFTSQPRYGRDVCQAMRDVNALEYVVPWMGTTTTSSNIILSFAHDSANNWYGVLGGAATTVYHSGGSWPTSYGAVAIAINASDDVFVYESDISNSKIFKYSTNGSEDSNWSPNKGGVKAMTCDAAGNLYCLEWDESSPYAAYIVKYNSSGTHQWSVAAHNAMISFAGLGIFAYGIDVDSSNNIYVTEWSGTGSIDATHIVKYNSSGTYQAQWDLDYAGLYSGSSPIFKGLSIDSTNGLIIAFRALFDGESGAYSYLARHSNVDGSVDWIKAITEITYTTEDAGYGLDVDSNDVARLYGYWYDESHEMRTYDMGQTEFVAYTSATANTTLGTPDAGVSVPSLEALTPADKDAIVTPRHLIDIRAAIEMLAPYYKPDGGSAYTFATLYAAAMGSGADWAETEAQLNGSPTKDREMYEIRACLDLLLDAVLV